VAAAQVLLVVMVTVFLEPAAMAVLDYHSLSVDH
jgi:hypothetical protein